MPISGCMFPLYNLPFFFKISASPLVRWDLDSETSTRETAPMWASSRLSPFLNVNNMESRHGKRNSQRWGVRTGLTFHIWSLLDLKLGCLIGCIWRVSLVPGSPYRLRPLGSVGSEHPNAVDWLKVSSRDLPCGWPKIFLWNWSSSNFTSRH